jgi:hypothetical protein
VLTRRLFLHVLCLLVLSVALRAAPSANLQIEVERGAWGQAAPADIAKVAQSAADEIWKYCPQIRMEAIRVYHRPDFPQTDFGRAADGRISIGLAVQNPRWAQLGFQFAHEFCHALAQQSSVGVRGWHESKQANLWLEESLCETASLFALRRMATTWKTRAPYPQWRGYASALSGYAADRMAMPVNRLPKGMTFRAWFAQNEAALRKNGALREKNVIVASQLLPLFEAEPAHWEAVPYLNIGPRVKNKTTAQKFADWRAASPAEHREFITRLAAVFGVAI